MSFNPIAVVGISGAALGLFAVGYVIYLFNNFIALKHLIEKSRANIDVLLKQRYDELPKLIQSVKGYVQHEAGVLQKLTQMRTKIMSSSLSAKAEADNQISSALKSIFAVAENYPQLKANQNFIQLQERISSIESEISQRREFYNETVNNYNIWIESFPNSLVAGIFKAEKAGLFKARNVKDVEVDL
ncbi:LemA family protein [Candidatus Woesearchaeota archaeon]|nr:LemA family protein [Candidatus Woesearchaeota archaeon]